MQRISPNVRLPLWPSSAEQWTVCSAAPRVNFLARKLPEKKADYTQEGIDAHAYLEALLTAPSQKATEVSDRMKTLVRERFPNIPDESKAILENFADDIYFRKEIEAAELTAEGKFPIKVGLTKQNPKIDVLLVSPSMITVIDLKWGKGHPVDVVRNKQLLMYALAVTPCFPDRKRIRLEIFQPRTGAGLSSWEPTVKDLLDAHITFSQAAMRAYEPNVEFVPGPHCKWCGGLRAGLCPELQRMAIDLEIKAVELEPTKNKGKGGLRYNMNEFKHPPWWALEFEKEITTFFKAIGERADFELDSGREVPGWSLGMKEGRSKWSDPNSVPDELVGIFGGDRSKYIRVQETPITITDAKKFAKTKKSKERLSALIEKPKSFVRVRSDENTLAVPPVEIEPPPPLIKHDEKKYDVWVEGFQATGQSGKACKLGTYSALSFDNAVEQYIAENPAEKPMYRFENNEHRIWGCQLFDNETEARKSFG